MQLVLHSIYNNVLLLGSLLGSLPFIFKNNEVCWTDDDCPYFMKCCYDGLNNYCCSPNKYVKNMYQFI